MNVVDSSGWLAYSAAEANASFFAAPIEDTAKLFVPTVCLYEVYKVALRESGQGEADRVIKAMRAGIVVDLTAELALEAAVLGRVERLALGDAIIYAVARKYSATLWTQDEHFAGKPNVRFKVKLGVL